MSQVERIRDMLAHGHTPTEVKTELGVSYPTIRKYAAQDDFSPKRPAAPAASSKLDPYKEYIAGMLEEDRHCYHKQRHTARRIFERLRDEHGYDGSYSTVQRYLREARSKGPKEQSIRLGWDPGTMQVDFGQADFDYAFGGGRVRMHYLPMSFPYSNHEVCEVFGDERDVCLCQGLKDCFEHIGGVPPVIVLDNATEAGRRWHDIVVESDLFRRLRLHYGFEACFCNPNAGREKGNVEGKVGYTRRRFFVPVPTIGDLRDFNHALQDAIDSHSEEQVHYEKGLAWAELFEADRSHLLPLPGKPFDVVKWESGKTDGYGRITLDGRHRYLASPELADTALVVGVRAFEVEIDAPDGTPLRTYPRRTGVAFTADEDPLALLDLLSVKVRAFRQSSVYRLFDDAVRAHLDSMQADELRGQVRAIYRLAAAYGMEIVAEAHSEALSRTGRMSPTDVEMCCARIAAGSDGQRRAVELGTRLSDYDALMERGGGKDA